jgi:hypothetical protein
MYTFEVVKGALDVRFKLTETESLLELVGADVATELEGLVVEARRTNCRLLPPWYLRKDL